MPETIRRFGTLTVAIILLASIAGTALAADHPRTVTTINDRARATWSIPLDNDETCLARVTQSSERVIDSDAGDKSVITRFVKFTCTTYATDGVTVIHRALFEAQAGALPYDTLLKGVRVHAAGTGTITNIVDGVESVEPAEFDIELRLAGTEDITYLSNTWSLPASEDPSMCWSYDALYGMRDATVVGTVFVNGAQMFDGVDAVGLLRHDEVVGELVPAP